LVIDVGIVRLGGHDATEATFDDDLIRANPVSMDKVNAHVHLFCQTINDCVDDEHAALPVREPAISYVGIGFFDVTKGDSIGI
jgi:hypothetical protein